MNQIANIIRRHWLPLLGWNSAILAATIYAVIASMNVPPVWKAKAQLDFPQSTSNLSADLGTLGNLNSGGALNFKDTNPLQSQLAILNSNAVFERLWATDLEKNLYPTPDSLRGLFEVSTEAGTTLVSLEAQGSRPDIAYRRVKALIEIYQQRLNELRHNDANARTGFAQEELEQARRALHQAQIDLVNFRKSTGITDAVEQTRVLISAINQLRTTQASLLAQAQANETQAQAAALRLGMTPQKAINSLRLGENQQYQAIRTKLAEVETALAQARSKYRDDTPQVQSLLVSRQELLRTLNQQIATAIPGANADEIDTTLGGNGDSRIDMIAELVRIQNTAQGLQQQASQLQIQINKFNAELNSITANQARLSDLQRRYEIAEGLYKGINAQTGQSKTSPFNIYPNVQAIDAPTIDPRAIRPKRELIIFGGMLAAIFGSMALVTLLETRNPLLKPKDLQELELPVLGSIPRLKRPDMERNLGAEIEIEFQRLASAILMQESPCLMVTSATSGEGKTTVTLGLALALVNFGFRVLIVDGDLRQVGMSRRLGHTSKKSKANANQTPIPIYPGLDLLPAPSMPKDKVAEFFARGSFERSLSTIRKSGSYDCVLVDSPPVALASETNLMSSVVCNVLFVVRSGTSDRYPVMDSLEQLVRHNARIMGLVINGVESRTAGYRYGYGHQRELLETEA